jgi:thiol-disulfide isomerase/thioredoxin
MRGELMFIPESVLEREIKALDNTTFRLADLHGKAMVINIWASWCGPCRREVPEYEKVRKAYVDRGVEFIALTAEDPRRASDNVIKFVRSVDFKFRVGWADRDLARVLMNGKEGIPQTLVIDANGGVIKHWTGYAPGRSTDRLKDAIDQALGSQSKN